jgi:hypothetical protein
MTSENEPQPADAAPPHQTPARPTRKKNLRRVALIALLCAVPGGAAGFGLAQLTDGTQKPTVVIKPSFSPSPEVSASPYETPSPGTLTSTPEPTPTGLTPSPELTSPTAPGATATSAIEPPTRAATP